VARSLVQNYLGNNPENLKSYETKMIGHVFPGESIQIETWKEGNKIIFLAGVVERKTKCLSGVLTIRENAKL
jgi:multifunctional beta-oxidation protein